MCVCVYIYIYIIYIYIYICVYIYVYVYIYISSVSGGRERDSGVRTLRPCVGRRGLLVGGWCWGGVVGFCVYVNEIKWMLGLFYVSNVY